MHIDEETIFHEALSRADPRDRADYLNIVCAGSANLKSRLNSLLMAYTSSEFLESTPPEVEEFLTAGQHGNLEGFQIGPYLMLELLGEGGMGEVYLAERYDGCTPHQVAIKVVKLGMDSRQVLARFRLEQEALKRLDHPHIARFLDSGVTDSGRLYFAMELVQGIPISQYCDRERLPIHERLKLLIDTCDAVQHAHERGFVHRDLKPDNVLVSLQASKPVVKVIDFGVAKALEESLIDAGPHTRATQFVGTPGYMSPEQTRWSADVDLRTDVFSLGALIYQMLTGTTPMRRDAANEVDPSELRHRIQTEEPPWPSQRIAQLEAGELEKVCTCRATEQRQLVRQIRGDLDWIALKSLEIDREKRYASPASLSADLIAYLGHRPIKARPPSIASRMSKWVKRNRRTLTTAAGIGLVAFAILGFLWFNRVILESRHRQREAQLATSRVESELAHNEFVRDIQETAAFLRAGNSRAAERLLNHYSSVAGQPYAEHFAVRYLRGQIPKPIQSFHGHQHDLLDMDVSKDGRWIASGDRGGDVIIWDRDAGLEVHRLHPSDTEVTRVRFSPDGRLLATAGQDRLVQLWKVGDWTPVCELAKHQSTINGLAWSPDSCKIASGDRDGNVFIWNVESQSCQQILPQHAEHVRCLAWSPDGKRLATASADQGVYVWDTEDWSHTAFISNNGKGTLAIAFSVDTRYMAFGGYSSELVVVDLATNTVVQRTEAQEQIWSLAFGRRYELIAGEASGFLQVFQHSVAKQTWESVRFVDVASRASSHRSLVYSADQQLLYVASEEDRLIKILSKSAVTGYQATELDQIPIGVVPELNYLLCADDGGGNATVRRADNNAMEFQLPITVSRYCLPEYSFSKNLIAVASEGRKRCYAYVFRPGTWEMVARLEFPSRIQGLSFSRDGKYLAVTGDRGLTRIWNLHTNDYRELTQGLGSSWAIAAFLPTSDVLVIGPAGSRKLTCLHAESLDEIRTITTLPNWHCLHYSADGNYIVIGEEGRVSVWTGDLSKFLWATPGSSVVGSKLVDSVCFSPDQGTIAILLNDGTVKFWDMQSRSELFSVPPPTSVREHRWISFADSTVLFLGSANETSLFSLRPAPSQPPLVPTSSTVPSSVETPSSLSGW